MPELQRLLDEHLARPFPPSVVKGTDYGGVDSVMVDSDIYGWASAIARGTHLSAEDLDRFESLSRQLVDAMPKFPAEARPYFEQLAQIANLALGLT